MSKYYYFRMETYVAERSEILRGSQKDDEFLNELQQRISELVKQIGSDATWIRLYKYLEPFTRLIYYSFTSIRGKHHFKMRSDQN